MTLGSERSAGTRALLRGLPVPSLGPLGHLNTRATAKIRARVKAQTPLAAQVEDPTASSHEQHQVRHRSAPGNHARVQLDEQRADSERATTDSRSERGRSNTTSSVLPTSSSASSIPAITISEISNRYPREGYYNPILAETEILPAEAGFETESAEETDTETFPGTTHRFVRASASSESLSGTLPATAPRTTLTQHLTGSTSALPQLLSATSPGTANAGRVTPGVDTPRDPRLITVRSLSVPRPLVSHFRLAAYLPPTLSDGVTFPSN